MGYHRRRSRPIIHGAIEQARQGATVRLRIRPSIFAAVFLLVWCSVGVFLLSGIPVESLRNLQTHALIPLGLLVFGLLFIALNFFAEAAIAIKLFRKALE